MHQQEPDSSLIYRASKRGKTAFAALYDRYMERVYRYVHYRVLNQADAEDITQEVFARAWNVIHKYERTLAPFSAWLITIARNLVMDHFRSKKKLVPLKNAEALNAEGKDNPASVSESNWDKAYIRDAVSKLKGDKRAVILMRFIDGYSYAEIAKILHKKEGAVRVIQYRALKELKRIVTQDEEDYERDHSYQLHRRDTGRQAYFGRMPGKVSRDS